MWQDLERRIRNIASNRWNCNATTETIAGVKCDCVLKPQPDEWIIVEITEESSLEKVDVSSRFLTFLHKMLSVVLILLRLICASTGVLKGH